MFLSLYRVCWDGCVRVLSVVVSLGGLLTGYFDFWVWFDCVLAVLV